MRHIFSSIKEAFGSVIPIAPLKTSEQIMEDVNREFGSKSYANGIIISIPTEKGYKI